MKKDGSYAQSGTSGVLLTSNPTLREEFQAVLDGVRHNGLPFLSECNGSDISVHSAQNSLKIVLNSYFEGILNFGQGNCDKPLYFSCQQQTPTVLNVSFLPSLQYRGNTLHS